MDKIITLVKLIAMLLVCSYYDDEHLNAQSANWSNQEHCTLVFCLVLV